MNPAPASPVSYRPLTVEARALECVRGGSLVFSNLSFRVASGQVLAVIGPNGSGKSSLLRILAGLLRPEAGELTIAAPASEQAVTHYLGHADALKPALTLRETLRFWSALYGGAGDLRAAAEAVGLGHALDLPAGVLSAGQRRRAGLARLMVSPRPLWLLDEPSLALDRAGETMLGALMRDHLSRGGIAIAATHADLPVAPDAVLDLGRAA